ncbi:MAG: sugar ABC transporter ATP-binding protein [Ancalomicrobiaceae bacterium]|nr:sugar ABC transporter ATP-binding protein [Ancalomicrobiaceae bacterium]
MQIVASKISRTFGSTRALIDVSVELHGGEIHALVGENGAGKSTLLKILGGAERPDSGSMTIDGAPYRPASLNEAVAHGVGLVFQEITINPSLTVAENILVGQLNRFSRGGLLTEKALARRAQELLDSFSAKISVRQSLSSLDLGQWKCIEIARALSTRPEAVFFDESTAFLNHREVEVVLTAMRALRDRGLAVAFVSHHLAEVGAVADRLTILKDGRKVGDFEAGELDREQIQSLMVGRDMSKGIYPERADRVDGRTALTLTNVGAGAQLAPLSLTVQQGEIVGIAGLKGAGGERLLEIVAGVERASSGEIQIGDEAGAARSPSEGWAKGVAYLPGDRSGEGVIVSASVLDNLVMAQPPRHGPWFDRARASGLATEMVDALHIKTASIKAPSSSLSGGNLQKVVLGKCLAVKPRILLLNNPTRGVDVGARLEIYRSLRESAAQGLAIVVVSEDLNELIGLSDRILVMRAGIVTARIDDPSGATEDALIRYMT